MAPRRVLLPVALLALAAVFCAPAFCGGAPAQAAPRAASAGRAALPVELADVDVSSVVTALQIQQPAWGANLIAVVLPITILITIYLQSERTLQERDAREGKTRMWALSG